VFFSLLFFVWFRILFENTGALHGSCACIDTHSFFCNGAGWSGFGLNASFYYNTPPVALTFGPMLTIQRLNESLKPAIIHLLNGAIYFLSCAESIHHTI